MDEDGDTAMESCCACADYATTTPAPTPSPAATSGECTDNTDFTYLVGYDWTTCDWFAEDPSYYCSSWGGDSWKDSDGDTANEVGGCLCSLLRPLALLRYLLD